MRRGGRASDRRKSNSVRSTNRLSLFFVAVTLFAYCLTSSLLTNITVGDDSPGDDSPAAVDDVAGRSTVIVFVC